ncbi:MAG: hypothetical protein MJ168_10855 [Clostridia bacterium]|nr:hypothetical protein [Clostridia bacterium]
MIYWDNENLPLTKLYSVQTGFKDNAITTEFDSGRTVQYQRNTKNKRVYSMKYLATRDQLEKFYNWYENELGGNAGTFFAPSLRNKETMQEYKFGELPIITGNYALKEITMTWVEV